MKQLIYIIFFMAITNFAIASDYNYDFSPSSISSHKVYVNREKHSYDSGVTVSANSNSNGVEFSTNTDISALNGSNVHGVEITAYEGIVSFSNQTASISKYNFQGAIL